MLFWFAIEWQGKVFFRLFSLFSATKFTYEFVYMKYHFIHLKSNKKVSHFSSKTKRKPNFTCTSIITNIIFAFFKLNQLNIYLKINSLTLCCFVSRQNIKISNKQTNKHFDSKRNLKKVSLLSLCEFSS